MDKDAAVTQIVSENLFQYHTERSLRKMALVCVRRLKAMGDGTLIAAIATQPSDAAKQVCLYAMMRQYRLVWGFMLTVVGEMYRLSYLEKIRSNMKQLLKGYDGIKLT